jgi:TM2 domain-containing membrane protein YozV
VLAAILGFIPGVGAMYNGEFAKGFIHVLIFATLIWMTDHLSGVFGLGIAAFVIYMPIEAYKTARARELGLPAPDPFGFNNWFSSAPAPVRPAPASDTPDSIVVSPTADPGTIPPVEPIPPVESLTDQPHSRVPVGAVILIGLGVLFLLDEMGALHFDWIWRFWPLILIAIGVRILMQRQRRGW